LVDDLRDSDLEKLNTSKEDNFMFVQKGGTRLSKGFKSLELKLIPSVLISIIDNNWTLLSA
jgi:hypothetical protein